MVRSQKSILLGLLAVLLLSSNAATQINPQLRIPEPSEESFAASAEKRVVVRVIDGDTIVVSPKETVRLIGVDTPETVHPKKKVADCFGKEATRFTRDAVEGKTIKLVMDKANTKRHHKDYYHRTLGYAYLEDGTMLNAELIRQGYAHAEIRFPFGHRGEFRELEKSARAQSVGLWANCPLR